MMVSSSKDPSQKLAPVAQAAPVEQSAPTPRMTPVPVRVPVGIVPVLLVAATPSMYRSKDVVSVLTAVKWCQVLSRYVAVVATW